MAETLSGLETSVWKYVLEGIEIRYPKKSGEDMQARRYMNDGAQNKTGFRDRKLWKPKPGVTSWWDEQSRTNRITVLGRLKLGEPVTGIKVYKRRVSHSKRRYVQRNRPN